MYDATIYNDNVVELGEEVQDDAHQHCSGGQLFSQKIKIERHLISNCLKMQVHNFWDRDKESLTYIEKITNKDEYDKVQEKFNRNISKI